MLAGRCTLIAAIAFSTYFCDRILLRQHFNKKFAIKHFLNDKSILSGVLRGPPIWAIAQNALLRMDEKATTFHNLRTERKPPV
jgi:hypothetical protein